jgi:hypothetical protein
MKSRIRSLFRRLQIPVPPPARLHLVVKPAGVAVHEALRPPGHPGEIFRSQPRGLCSFVLDESGEALRVDAGGPADTLEEVLEFGEESAGGLLRARPDVEKVVYVLGQTESGKPFTPR